MTNEQLDKRVLSDRERVYEQLRHDILSNIIKPSERIIEAVYAKKCNLSRTPVREALRMLEQEGLVAFTRAKGAVARALPTRNEIQEIFSIRAILQMMGIDHTMHHITDQELDKMEACLKSCDAALEASDELSFIRSYDRFNYLLLNGAHMPVLMKMLMLLENYNPVISVAGMGKNAEHSASARDAAVPGMERKREANAEHYTIWRALKARNRSAYAAALKTHLERAKDICLKNCESMLDEADAAPMGEIALPTYEQVLADAQGERRRFLVLNGSNMNLMGERGPLYGEATLFDIHDALGALALELGVEVICFQSNFEGELIEKLHEYRHQVDGVIFNPAGFTFASYSIRDAIAACAHRVVEVHTTNMFAREEFRSRSVIAPVCEGYLCGLGTKGYEAALRYLAM